MNIEKIIEHYEKAKRKHPVFCTAITTRPKDDADTLLGFYRCLADKKKTAEYIALEELYEAITAHIDGDRYNAVEECYDAIAVLIRMIEFMEKN